MLFTVSLTVHKITSHNGHRQAVTRNAVDYRKCRIIGLKIIDQKYHTL